MVMSQEDFNSAFGKENFAVVKGQIVLKKGTTLSSGGVLIDDENIFDRTDEKMDFLNSSQKEQSDYMDFHYGIDNHYFYGSEHDKGDVLNTTDIEVLSQCLDMLD